jgi:hypothetical protein
MHSLHPHQNDEVYLLHSVTSIVDLQRQCHEVDFNEVRLAGFVVVIEIFSTRRRSLEPRPLAGNHHLS